MARFCACKAVVRSQTTMGVVDVTACSLATPDHAAVNAARLPDSAAAWLASGIERCRTGIVDRDLYLLMSAVSRHVGNAPLALTDSELAAAARNFPPTLTTRHPPRPH